MISMHPHVVLIKPPSPPLPLPSPCKAKRMGPCKCAIKAFIGFIKISSTRLHNLDNNLVRTYALIKTNWLRLRLKQKFGSLQTSKIQWYIWNKPCTMILLFWNVFWLMWFCKMYIGFLSCIVVFNQIRISSCGPLMYITPPCVAIYVTRSKDLILMRLCCIE